MTPLEMDEMLHARYKRGGLITWDELPEGLRITPEKFDAWRQEHHRNHNLPAPRFFARLVDDRYCHAAVPWSWPCYWSRCSQLAIYKTRTERTKEGRPYGWREVGHINGYCTKHGTPLTCRPELDPDRLADIWAELDPSVYA